MSWTTYTRIALRRLPVQVTEEDLLKTPQIAEVLLIPYSSLSFYPYSLIGETAAAPSSMAILTIPSASFEKQIITNLSSITFENLKSIRPLVDYAPLSAVPKIERTQIQIKSSIDEDTDFIEFKNRVNTDTSDAPIVGPSSYFPEQVTEEELAEQFVRSVQRSQHDLYGSRSRQPSNNRSSRRQSKKKRNPQNPADAVSQELPQSLEQQLLKAQGGSTTLPQERNTESPAEQQTDVSNPNRSIPPPKSKSRSKSRSRAPRGENKQNVTK